MSEPDPYAEAESPFIQQPLKATKGRGAVSNLQGRYEALIREDIDDGWASPAGNTAETDSANDISGPFAESVSAVLPAGLAQPSSMSSRINAS